VSHSDHKDKVKDKDKEKQQAPIDVPIVGSISTGSSTRSSGSAGVSAAQQAEDAGSVAMLSEQVRNLQAEKQELMNTMVRRQADFENYRKRVEKERAQDRERALESLVERILPVLDAFDRALSGQGDSASAEYLKGFELIHRQLWDGLAKQGLVRIESLGKEFNPHFHHAIERVPTADHKDGEVISELQPGYLLHERVLRPAMVRVATEADPNSVSVSRAEN
jgi:molecular chaperone GrpE